MKTNLIRKKIFFLTLIFFSTFHSFGQIFPPTGSYNYRPEYDKFVGTWKWNSGNNEVVVKLKKMMYYYRMNGGYYEERIVGCYRYVRNGIVVEDYLSQFDTLTRSNPTSLLLSTSNFFSPDGLRIAGLVRDIFLNKNEELRLTYSAGGSAPTLTWELYAMGISYRPGIDPTPTGETTLPQDLILIKQP